MPDNATGDGEFTTELTDEGGHPVVRVRGDIDIATADEFGECIDAALEQDPRLVIDLSESPFMDSTGLSVLVRAYHASGQVKEAVVVRRPCAAVRRTLQISGIEDLITIEL